MGQYCTIHCADVHMAERREVRGDWRKLHNAGPHNLYCSPNVIRVIKPRKVGWTGHVARMGRGEICVGLW